tara:strand:- start:67 stop:558 length:492 start_codon:yes stop_codon:yes gene_type:complete
MINQNILKQNLSYNPETGEFMWLVNRGPARKFAHAGSKHKSGYLHIYLFGKHYLCHRLAWLYVYGDWPLQYLDHINGNKKDNTIKNLRDVDSALNQQNQKNPPITNKSGFVGAHWDKRKNKWISQISVYGKKIHLGNFDSKENAATAYKKAKENLHLGYVNDV